MPEVTVAIGSNMGDRIAHLEQGLACLKRIALQPLLVSPIYESEPVGPGSTEFLNAVVVLHTSIYPNELLLLLKECEHSCGRDPNAPRWTDRPLDMDIIGWGRRIFKSPIIQIPHASYRDRLFVLLPLRDVCPGWTDPETGIHIDRLIESAMPMKIHSIGYVDNGKLCS